MQYLCICISQSYQSQLSSCCCHVTKGWTYGWQVLVGIVTGFGTRAGLWLGYSRVRVRVRISDPRTHKTSPRTSKIDKN